ncbi:MAG: hypothetical protein OEP48_02735 [Betaproteobacteria bacterium]|nr:hypothetical protein [Betaproteobacteria bacterium]MDH3435893.1 hypothetical protein [Betaproteobacteria bacterium]
MKTYLAALAIAACAPLATAQQPAPRSGPADPAAPAPVFRYESAFSGYRGFREEPLAPWRDVNDEVARVGGHIGIMRGTSGGHGSAKPGAKPPAGNTAPGGEAGRPQ